ncbi:hypothetical protein KEM56_007834 [Ascosphaera pollenicola]|nr:hypothetical protein KEM56_007834 [Ascosphaera pollenicola]
MVSRYPHIYIVGAHSTGKTTLFESLSIMMRNYIKAANLPISLYTIEERARIVHQSGIFSRQDLEDKKMRSHDLQHLVQKLQFEAEDQALVAASKAADQPLLLCDRSGLDPIAYDLLYAPSWDETQRRLIATPTWKIMRERMRQSLVVVCPIQPKFIKDDGLRLIEQDLKAWDCLHAKFCELLEEHGIPFHVVPVNLLDAEERAQYVFRLWKSHVSPMADRVLSPGRETNEILLEA